MANLSKELKKLFFAHLKNKNKPREYGSVVTHRPTPTTYQPSLFNSGVIGCIYFYEWSDTNRTPKTYYTLNAFEKFLNDCHIYLLSWQREVISHMKHPYVACKKGKKEIVIKNSFSELSKAIEEGSSVENAFKNNPFTDTCAHNGNEPYNVAITRPPSMRHMHAMVEPDGRWSEDGHYFG